LNVTNREPTPEPHLPGVLARHDDSRMRRRNLVVLAVLVVFVAFAFILSFSHVAMEAGGAAQQTRS